MSEKKEKKVLVKTTKENTDHYINFTNKISNLHSVKVDFEHDLIKRNYWSAICTKDQTVHYKPYYQSYNYTVAVYEMNNGVEGSLIGKYQYACCEDGSVTITISGTSSNPTFTKS